MKKPPIYSIYLAIFCLVVATFCSCFFILLLFSKQYVLAIGFGLFLVFFLAGGLILLIPGLIRRKNRVLGVYGERKIIVEHLGNTIEVYNYTTALSVVNHITLVINNYVVDRFGGIANSILHGKIQTLEGEKPITLISNNFIGTLKLYCEDTLLAKKFMFFG